MSGEEDEAGVEELEHDQLRSRFWLLVVLFNFGPIAFFLGVFLLVFEGMEEGLLVAGTGLLVTVAGLRLYRRTESRIPSDGRVD